MQKISLKKMICNGDALELLRTLVADTKSAISIEDVDGNVLVSDLGEAPCLSSGHSPTYFRLPIILDGVVIGRVCGEGQVAALADFISYLGKREAERKTLATELLDK
ncbi:MAG: hypothetical protein WCP86_03395 [bacterium]